jgi:predicted RecB family nuclease
MSEQQFARVTKHVLREAHTCFRRGWKLARHAETHDIAALAIFLQGNIAEGLAMNDFPGVLISGRGVAAVQATRNHLAGLTQRLQQPVFQVLDVMLAPDIYEIGNGHVLDVKSGKSVKEKYILDIVISAAAVQAAGYPVEVLAITHMNPDYRADGAESPFITKDVTSRARGLLKDYDIVEIIQRLNSEQKPEPVMSKACKGCEFAQDCFGTANGLVATIPRISKKALNSLVAASVFTIDQLLQRPDLHHILTVNQCDFVEAQRFAADNQTAPTINIGVLESCIWLQAPVHLHLDFEAVTLALPTRISDAPWAQSLTQFSVSTDDGENYAEVGFLSDGSDDREQLAHALIEALPGTAPIVVYNESYERKRIEELATLYPHLNESLKAILQRLVDLRPLANDAIVGLAGGSLKMVSPWADAEFSYDDLVISNGKLANAAMQLLMLEGGEAILKSSTGLSREEVRAELLSYCARDTMATAVVVRRFKQLLAGEGAPSTVEHGV